MLYHLFSQKEVAAGGRKHFEGQGLPIHFHHIFPPITYVTLRLHSVSVPCTIAEILRDNTAQDMQLLKQHTSPQPPH